MKRLFAAIAALTAAVGGALMLNRKTALREDIPWEDAPRPGSIAEIDGYKVHYIDRGDGPAMVLIHGFGGQTYNYRKLIPRFAAGHRVIAVDLKGYGYSERDASTDLSATGQVRMLRALLAQLGVQRAVFVGHSMGGAIVQRFASTHPEMCEALVLIASVAGDEARRRRMVMLPRPILRPLLPVFGKMVSSQLLKYSFYDQSFATEADREEYLRPARLKGSMDGLLAIIEEGRRDEPIAYERIDVPVLLIYGAQDRVVPLAKAREVRAHLPQARLVVIERAAHLLLEERAEECARAIEDFLREQARSEAGHRRAPEVGLPPHRVR